MSAWIDIDYLVPNHVPDYKFEQLITDAPTRLARTVEIIAEQQGIIEDKLNKAGVELGDTVPPTLKYYLAIMTKYQLYMRYDTVPPDLLAEYLRIVGNPGSEGLLDNLGDEGFGSTGSAASTAFLANYEASQSRWSLENIDTNYPRQGFGRNLKLPRS